ncbi:hypothetical protein KP615_09360 [Treponema denticola]|uniref:hypothetical protein n=1 Tax=Treponema denticola TaxID=158 RepID=UPI003D08EA16
MILLLYNWKIIAFILLLIFSLLFFAFFKVLSNVLKEAAVQIDWGKKILAKVDNPLIRLVEGKNINIGANLLSMGERLYNTGKILQKIILALSIIVLLGSLFFLLLFFIS